MKNASIVILLTTIAFSCKFNSLKNKIDTELVNAISDGKDTVNFGDLGEDYDSLLILRPYSTPSYIATTLKLDLRPIENTNIQQRDDILLFVLLKNRTIVASAEISAYNYSYEEKNVKVYPKKHSFILEKGQNGENNFFMIRAQ